MRHARSPLPVATLLALGLFALAPTARAACEGAEHRQFDFWLGTWEVRGPKGNVAGMNRIEKEQGGCVLHERYSTDRGYDGQSLNIYDASRKVWHQTWVDNRGALLELEGGLRDGKMVLEGETVGADGQTTRQRITWTPNSDGTVRQHWESASPGGSWTTVFDGLYRRQ